jgi:hypothetical protein
VTLRLPVEFADYVDFYASEYHAANLGRLFRPGTPDPLTPNWKHLPIGYRGRAGSIVVSDTDIVRPAGQRKDPGDPVPVFGPSVRLDIEAGLGFIVGTGSPMGEPIPAAQAERNIFGVVLFNDWSARDIEAWEYVPLGPNTTARYGTWETSVGRPAAHRWPALSRGLFLPAGPAAVRDDQVRPGASSPAGHAEPQSRRVLGRQPRPVPHMVPGTRIMLVEVAAFPATLGADDLPAAEGAGFPAARCGKCGIRHLRVLSAAGLVGGGQELTRRCPALGPRSTRKRPIRIPGGRSSPRQFRAIIRATRPDRPGGLRQPGTGY